VEFDASEGAGAALTGGDCGEDICGIDGWDPEVMEGYDMLSGLPLSVRI
jgi:hypothetical protein